MSCLRHSPRAAVAFDIEKPDQTRPFSSTCQCAQPARSKDPGPSSLRTFALILRSLGVKQGASAGR
jgi:hypothetical protein